MINIMQNKNEPINNINHYYSIITKGVELINNSNINGLIIKSKQGIGKSYWIDKTLEELKLNYIVFKGTISEARFFKFIQDNSDKIIVMRDCGSMLRKITFLDFLKSATDTIPIRIISRLTYAEHEDVPETISFSGKLIFELNDMPKRNLEDLKAVISRSLYIELNFSKDDLINIMRLISVTEEEKLATSYLVSKLDLISNESFNLRTREMCINILKDSLIKKLDWKKEIDQFLNTQISELKKLLYRFTGNNPCNRLDFVKFLMKEKELSYSTSERRIKEGLILGDIYTDFKLKRQKLSINKLN
jgi:hypothetical protein